MLRALLTCATAQVLFDDAVNLQIRITANGRSKVRIVAGCEAEVPDTFHRITRLRHGAKRHAAHQILGLSALDAEQKLLDFPRRDLTILERQVQAEVRDKSL